MKKVFTIFFVGLLFPQIGLANNIMDSTKEVNKLFTNTVNTVNKNPASVKTMIDIIKKEDVLVNSLQKTEQLNEEQLKYARKYSLNLARKVLEDERLTQKILLQFEQTKEFASENAKNSEIRKYISEKVVNDLYFCNSILNLLTPTELKKLEY